MSRRQKVVWLALLLALLATVAGDNQSPTTLVVEGEQHQELNK